MQTEINSTHIICMSYTDTPTIPVYKFSWTMMTNWSNDKTIIRLLGVQRQIGAILFILGSFLWCNGFVSQLLAGVQWHDCCRYESLNGESKRSHQLGWHSALKEDRGRAFWITHCCVGLAGRVLQCAVLQQIVAVFCAFRNDSWNSNGNSTLPLKRMS